MNPDSISQETFAVGEPSPRSIQRLPHVFFHCSPLAVFSVDREQRVLLWNKEAQRLFGWSAADVAGKHPPFVLERDREQFTSTIQTTLAGRPSANWDTIGRCANGIKVHLRMTAIPLFDDTGMVDQVALTVINSTTERTLQSLLKIQAAVSTAISRDEAMEFAVPRILDALCSNFGCRFGEFWQADSETEDWHRLAVWRAAETDTSLLDAATFPTMSLDRGIPLQLRTGRAITWLPNLMECEDDPRAKPAARCGLHDALAIPLIVREKVVGGIILFDFEINEPDEPLLSVLNGVAEQVAQFVKKSQTEAALRTSEEARRQSQKMEAIGHLAGGIAHDFNNLLTVILGRGEIIADSLDASSPLVPMISEIDKAAERAAALTRQLLAFSRKQDVESKVLNLNSRVRDAEQMLRRLVGENIAFETHLADGLHPVKVDPSHIEQVLLNLVVNARDAMKDGGRLTVETRNVVLTARDFNTFPESQPGDYAAIVVADTGCGMDERTRARIFEPFFTTKPIGQGTGMGLSTVYGVVKQNDGLIHVESQPGLGTAFLILFPRTSDMLVTLEVNSELPDLPCGSETILLVEDDSAVRSLTADLLKSRGYTVLTAESGAEALQIAGLDSTPIDLLVTDVVMPEMNGPQVAERVSSIRPGVHVLFVSGYTDSTVLVRDIVRPGRLLLNKPFTSESLARKVREALAQ